MELIAILLAAAQSAFLFGAFFGALNTRSAGGVQHVKHAVSPIWFLDVLLEQLSRLLDVSDSYLGMLQSSQHDDGHERDLAKIVD